MTCGPDISQKRDRSKALNSNSDSNHEDKIDVGDRWAVVRVSRGGDMDIADGRIASADAFRAGGADPDASR